MASRSHIDEHIAIVRAHSIDSYLSTLFIPARYRNAIYTLHAFNAEISRIRGMVNEPAMGEIRLQWWQEVIEGERGGEANSYPLAANLLAVIKQYSLPKQLFSNLLSARVFDLYSDPMGNLHDFEGYSGETCGGLLQMVATVVNEGKPPHSGDCAGHAGMVLSLLDILTSLPQHRAQQQCFLPADLMQEAGFTMQSYYPGTQDRSADRMVKSLVSLAHDHMDKFRAAVPGILVHARTAFLSLALAEQYLERIDKAGMKALIVPIDIPQWRKQIILWRAAKKGFY